MKIKREKLIRGTDIMQGLILSAMLETFKDKTFAQFMNDVDWHNQEEIEVKLLVEGQELNFEDFCERWQSNVEKFVNERAVEIVEEQFADIVNLANKAQTQVRLKLKEKLGVEITEDDYR